MPTNEPTVPVSALRALLARWEVWQAAAELGAAAESAAVITRERLDAVRGAVHITRHDLTVLIDKYAPDREVCDAQEHETEADYRACPICNPPFPDGDTR